MIEFLTSAMIGGLIYDVVKKGTVLFKDISEEVLSKYTEDESVISDFTDLLSKYNINNTKSREEIIDILESNSEMKNILYIINSNITINQNANTINNFIGNDKKQKPTKEELESTIGRLPFSMKVYRNFGVDYLFIPLLVMLMLIGSYFHLNINPLCYLSLIAPWYLFIHFLISSVFISVYQDKVLIGEKELSYLDIRSYSFKGNSFSYKLHDDDRNHTIRFYSYNSAEFLFHKVDTFSMETGLKIK